MPKHFVDAATAKTLSDSHAVVLPDELMHHLTNVLRVRVREAVIFCDGNNMDYHCIVEGLAPLKFVLQRQASCDTELPCKVVMFQGLPKGAKLDTIIQKSVELGAAEIVPVAMERSIARDNRSKTARRQKIALGAAEQSMRGIIPKVHDVLSWEEAMNYARNLGGSILVPHETHGRLNILQTLQNQPAQKAVGIWIGPEGGFSEKETLQMQDFIFVTLGKRILRTETAGLAALAQLSLAL